MSLFSLPNSNRSGSPLYLYNNSLRSPVLPTSPLYINDRELSPEHYYVSPEQPKYVYRPTPELNRQKRNNQPRYVYTPTPELNQQNRNEQPRYVYTPTPELIVDETQYKLGRPPTPPSRKLREQAKHRSWKNPKSGIQYSEV